MSTKTQNYQLIKPDLSDSADIRMSHNTNMDLIEAGLFKHDNNISNHAATLVTNTNGVHGLQIESGTFTPTVGVFNGTILGLTYSRQEGTYYRIGGLVFVKLYVTVSAKGTASGSNTAFIISGLPFACDTYNNARNYLPGVSNALSSNTISGRLEPGTAYMVITKELNGDVNYNDLNSSFMLALSGIYNIK